MIRLIQLMDSTNTEMISVFKLKNDTEKYKSEYKSAVYRMKRYKSGWGRVVEKSYKEGFFEIVLSFKKQGYNVISPLRVVEEES